MRGVCSSGEEILCSPDLPPDCDNLPTSEQFCVLCAPSPAPVPGRQNTADVFIVPAAALPGTAALYSYHRGSAELCWDCWIIRRVDGTERRSVDLSQPSTFFIVIVASLPHVWSDYDYPMALMIERQDWGLGVINDFQSCHHLPNLCAGSPGLQSHVPGSQAVPVLPVP